MSLIELQFMIELLCGINNPMVPKANAAQCIDYYANCAIGPGGRIDKETAIKCASEIKQKQTEDENNVRY